MGRSGIAINRSTVLLLKIAGREDQQKKGKESKWENDGCYSYCYIEESARPGSWSILYILDNHKKKFLSFEWVRYFIAIYVHWSLVSLLI